MGILRSKFALAMLFCSVLFGCGPEDEPPVVVAYRGALDWQIDWAIKKEIVDPSILHFVEAPEGMTLEPSIDEGTVHLAFLSVAELLDWQNIMRRPDIIYATALSDQGTPLREKLKSSAFDDVRVVALLVDPGVDLPLLEKGIEALFAILEIAARDASSNQPPNASYTPTLQDNAGLLRTDSGIMIDWLIRNTPNSDPNLTPLDGILAIQPRYVREAIERQEGQF